MEIDDGRYRLIRRLGEGGTGVVYQAADAVLGRTVAVKALHQSLAVDLLRSEGQSLACLNHPNVVAMYDVIETRERPYLIMEYVEGCNLEQWMTERESLPMEQALEIVRRVGLAIAEAHSRGILHCDLKPANVLISLTGEVKLTDFTLAHRFLDGNFHGPMGGSTECAAPEQIRREAVSPRTDIYGLGALLRRMVGVVDTSSPQIQQVTAVVERAMSLAPQERFASAEEFLTALPEAQPGLTRVAPLSRTSNLTRIAPSGRSRKEPRVSRPWWLLATVSTVLILSVLVSTLALFTRLNAAASPARITVPDLVATQSQSAQLVVRSLALGYRVRLAYSSLIPAGIVMSQRPMPGSQVPARALVTLFVSNGPKPMVVPDLHHLSQSVAIRTVQRLGFRVVTVTQDSISDDSGIILDQTPLPGLQRLPGTTIVLTVSTKPWWWIF